MSSGFGSVKTIRSPSGNAESWIVRPLQDSCAQAAPMRVPDGLFPFAAILDGVGDHRSLLKSHAVTASSWWRSISALAPAASLNSSAGKSSAVWLHYAIGRRLLQH